MFLDVIGSKTGKFKGESQDSKSKGQIDIETYSWDVTQPVGKNSGGLASGKRELGFFVVTFVTSTATAQALNCCCNGEHLTKVVLTCRKAGKEQMEYMKWTLTTAMIAKLECFYLPDDIVPRNRVAFAYKKIAFEIKAQNADGTLGGSYLAEDDLGY